MAKPGVPVQKPFGALKQTGITGRLRRGLRLAPYSSSACPVPIARTATVPLWRVRRTAPMGKGRRFTRYGSLADRIRTLCDGHHILRDAPPIVCCNHPGRGRASSAAMFRFKKSCAKRKDMNKPPRDEFGIHRSVARHDRQPALDNEGVVRLLRSEVKRAGGQSSWARRERIDRTMLNRVGTRRPPTRSSERSKSVMSMHRTMTTSPIDAVDTPRARR